MRLLTDDLWRPEMPLPGKRILRDIAARCAQVWEMPELPDQVKIAWNPRLRTTLGQAKLLENRVELNTRLLREHPDHLVPTLVHELAHAAVHLRYGPVSPHGRHFRTLMIAAGFSPKSTHDLPVKHLLRKRNRYLYLHRCSDCGYSFVSRSVRRNCYCLACGPEMTWHVVRAPATATGKKALSKLQTTGEKS